MHETGWRPFIELCLATKDGAILAELFELFLTPEEKESLAARYLIIAELLKQQKTQRDIAEELQVSIAKITRGSNELKRTSPKLIKFLQAKLSG